MIKLVVMQGHIKDLPGTKGPYTCKQFNHEKATEYQTQDPQSLLRVQQPLADTVAIPARMFTHIQADQEVGKDTANVKGYKGEHGIVPKLGSEEALNLPASWVERAVLSSTCR